MAGDAADRERRKGHNMFLLDRPARAVFAFALLAGAAEAQDASLAPGRPYAPFAPQPATAYSTAAFDPHGTGYHGLADAPSDPTEKWWIHPDHRAQGAFVQYDRIYWSLNAPNATTIGSDAAEGPVTVNGITYNRTNSLDTSFLSGDPSWGDRIEVGWMGARHGILLGFSQFQSRQQLQATGVEFAPNDPSGLLAGYQDADGDGYDDDLDLDLIYGRHGIDLGTFDSAVPGYVLPFDGVPDAGAPIDTDDLVFWLPNFSSFTATSLLTLTDFECRGIVRQQDFGDRRLDVYYGVRYLGVRDEFSASGFGGVLDASQWSALMDNRLIGPEFGFRWMRRWSFVTFALEGRAMPAMNLLSTHLDGVVATNITNAAGGPAALSPSTLDTNDFDIDFGFVGEWRCDLQLAVNDWCALRVGYTGMAIGGLARAASSIEYTLPTFQLNPSANDWLFAHGLTLGVVFNR